MHVLQQRVDFNVQDLAGEMEVMRTMAMNQQLLLMQLAPIGTGGVNLGRGVAGKNGWMGWLEIGES